GSKVSARKAPPPALPPPPEPDFEEVPEDEDTQQTDDGDRDDRGYDDQDNGEAPPRKKKKKKRRSRDSDYLQPHRGQLVMILGIGSLALLFFAGGIGWPLGLVAWILGNMDLKEMREGRMDPEGEGPTSAGRICGMITTIMGIVSMVFGLLAVCLWFSCFGAM